MADSALEYWLWYVRDPASGRRYVTQCRLCEADALDLDPYAERVPGSEEPNWVSDVPPARPDTRPVRSRPVRR